MNENACFALLYAEAVVVYARRYTRSHISQQFDRLLVSPKQFHTRYHDCRCACACASPGRGISNCDHPVCAIVNTSSVVFLFLYNCIPAHSNAVLVCLKHILMEIILSYSSQVSISRCKVSHKLKGRWFDKVDLIWMNLSNKSTFIKALSSLRTFISFLNNLMQIECEFAISRQLVKSIHHCCSDIEWVFTCPLKYSYTHCVSTPAT